MRTASLLIATLLLAPQTTQRRTDNPLDRLPPNVEMLTHFGERADISPNDHQIAFIAKNFNDAFVIELETQTIRYLTCNVPKTAFLLMHSRAGTTSSSALTEDVSAVLARQQLWFLSRAGSRPVKLGRRMSEGAAV
jgi:hypothetical protein